MLAHQPDTKAPNKRLPAGACDCHFHVFADTANYPPAAKRAYDPPAATLSDLRRMHSVLGLSRGVIVQPTVYGTDNRLLADSLAGHPEYRGIAVIGDDTSDTELRRLDAAGVRGIRLQMGGTPDFASYDRCIGRVKSMGWHIKLGGGVADLVRHADWVRALPVRCVIDHLGAPDMTKGVDHAEFQFLLELLRDERFWILLSNGDRRAAGAAPWVDAEPFIAAAQRAAPERALWASDWPHLLYTKPETPNDGDLLDLLYRAVPNDAAVTKILVDNPARLYDFPGA